jgi:hypothetical protein
MPRRRTRRGRVGGEVFLALATVYDQLGQADEAQRAAAAAAARLGERRLRLDATAIIGRSLYRSGNYRGALIALREVPRRVRTARRRFSGSGSPTMGRATTPRRSRTTNAPPRSTQTTSTSASTWALPTCARALRRRRERLRPHHPAKQRRRRGVLQPRLGALSQGPRRGGAGGVGSSLGTRVRTGAGCPDRVFRVGRPLKPAFIVAPGGVTPKCIWSYNKVMDWLRRNWPDLLIGCRTRRGHCDDRRYAAEWRLARLTRAAGHPPRTPHHHRARYRGG